MSSTTKAGYLAQILWALHPDSVMSSTLTPREATKDYINFLFYFGIYVDSNQAFKMIFLMTGTGILLPKCFNFLNIYV